MIRLRLRIERNELPAVSTLWPVPDSSLKHTVAQLLEQVSVAFPLESQTWGLEHYTVTVGGYECLHYHVIGEVCRDEDEVVIRPLQYAEVRARTLLGRDQISRDGRRLADGVPFGRSKIQGVTRPEVRIPPRKRRRLEDRDEVAAVGGDEVGDGTLVRFEAVESEDDDDDEEDEDFEEEDEEDGNEDEEDSTAEASNSSSSGEDSSDKDESDDSDTSGTSSSSDSDTDSDTSSSDDSWDGIDEKHAHTNRTAARETELGSRMDLSNAPLQTNGVSPNSNTTSVTAAQTPAGSAATASATRSEPKPQFVGVPNEGKAETQTRNARRRDQKQLRHLKERGELPPGATLIDMREWRQNRVQPSATDMSAAVQLPDQSLVGESPEEPATSMDNTSTETLGRSPREDEQRQQAKTKSPEFDERRQTLLDAIANGGVEVGVKKRTKRAISQVDGEDSDESPETMSSKAPPATNESDKRGAMNAAAPPKSLKATDMVPSSVARRSKLDLNSSKRMLYKSLGERVPKTPEEEAALQARLSARAKQPAAPSANLHAPTNGKAPVDSLEETTKQDTQQAEDDEESWREKLDVSAVECVDEDVHLSAPPFPFHQRWDPQQWRKKSRARNAPQYAIQNKRKKRRIRDTFTEDSWVESYDKYNTDGTGDALDYDDPVEEDEYWDDSALLGDDYDEEAFDDAAAQQLQDEAANNEADDDGFPNLTADLSQLPTITEADAKKDDFIVFTEMVCSAATAWQPATLTRTAQLLSQDEDGWKIKMALRDMPPKAYDADGKRIYRKFEMAGLSDGEEEEGDSRERTVSWGEMAEPRLLLRADAEGVTAEATTAET